MSKEYPQADPYDADINNFDRAMEKKREVLGRNKPSYTIFKIILAILLGAMLIAMCGHALGS